jgi:hypothetical protein
MHSVGIWGRLRRKQIVCDFFHGIYSLLENTLLFLGICLIINLPSIVYIENYWNQHYIMLEIHKLGFYY